MSEAVMNNKPVGRAPNYTNACIAMFGVNIAWVLVLIWTFWGLIAAMLLALGLSHAMERAKVWAAARHAASLRRGKNF